MLKGRKVGLVGIERRDLKQLLDWRNNPDFRKHFREHRELNMQQQEKWYEERVLKDPATIMFSIRRLGDDELLGACGLVYINWVYKHADLSLYIGWNDSYIDREGYAEETTRLMLDYAFNEMGLNKVWTEIYLFDKKKKKLYDGFGFHIDGVLRQNYFYEGRYWDSYILSILASEWKRSRKRV